MSDLTSKDLRNLAKELVSQERTKPTRVYTEQEIAKSKHPDKHCILCDQLGSQKKYAGEYIHISCLRLIKHNTDKVLQVKTLPTH